MYMFKYLTIFIIFFSNAAFSGNAPFGMDWGTSKEDLKNSGIIFTSNENENRLEVLQSSSLNKNLSIADFYLLIVSEKYGLQKIVMISKDISSDITGSKGKEKYSGIKNKLIKKYGNPSDHLETWGNSLWDKYDEFYQCLKYPGCGTWISFWKPEQTESGYVSLELKGLSRGKGYVSLGYEGPLFSKAKSDINSETESSDDEAL